MPVITLPDGSKREFANPVSVFDVAADIGAGLAKAALAGKVNGELVDTSFTIENDTDLAIITARDDEGVDVIRHSCAHLMAMAVQALFPGAQVTIGPVIENGFYYDFAYERPFTSEDLEKIEKKMLELSKQNLPVSRSVMNRDEAVALFEKMGESYKVEILSSIPAEQDLSFYSQGDFIDLCRGPHVPSTGHIKAFKLMKVAGAYWRGDSKNEMLQRIYGTAWSDKKQLKEYLHRLEEAEKRDHRKLGKQLNLFHLQEEAPGMVFWHPNGWTLYQQIEQYMRVKQRVNGYQEIKTPQVVERTLWEKSGHWDKFAEQMFTTHSENKDFAVKPMNCPCHIQVFNQGLRSYRDLPLRLAEFGSCHRNEPSGALHGIMRVRGFVQDDAHIFCAEDAIQPEVASFIEFLHEVYHDFGFTDVIYKLSTRPEQRVGSDEVWDKAEKALADALDAAGLDWEELPGEGAFYGPKIEFSLKDCLGRVWQCGTIQVDFSMPGRLEAQFVNEHGDRETPVMLHRAILGSFERFIGILIEHYAGALPAWLAPTQAVVMNITDNQAEYCTNVVKTLQNNGFRAVSDLRNEKIGFKIRERTLQKVPFLLVVGDKEVENGCVAVRTRSGEDLGTMTIEAFSEFLSKDVERKGRDD
ncbi:threonine--tRNA ligase [Neptunomonas phycophila]|jgi:threonyl-tRNA synthetase|uniref:Threonine--tRNA ligase n=3 Tax=Neptunomonas phycophila TaxID=1572645 RepID=A0AAW7XLE2_9GAMM|nr:threonine--tRNA ligase [Neptunomonas phycophila]MBT3146667.1 threonine--tRNA ligase [Neptunomonas phycophila]MDO6454561.1 threonine--tRNA ligase [Neptunomonas phycophila]MDO6468863.1 threonine--tRNA ligase [Neptunomonas phycophila]MDO6782867.1 threonine--tRNA ligase [Neptunomonas phycophila]MDP2522818.1 threonine--tRNA ligase [Neptunomonas phycophila]